MVKNAFTKRAIYCSNIRKQLPKNRVKFRHKVLSQIWDMFDTRITTNVNITLCVHHRKRERPDCLSDP